jgi:Flp pilus assembly protein TadD/thiol-disulfide isomerase/thioredoxin
MVLRIGFCVAVLAVCACLAPAQEGSEDAATAYRHGVELHRAGDLEGAIREYAASLKLDPANPQALSNLGAAYAAEGRYDEAIAEYTKALALDPSMEGVRLNLGLAYYKSARYGEAEKEFAAVHEATPGDVRPALLDADCALRTGRTKEAADVLAPYATANEQNLAYDYLYGMALIRSGQVEAGQVWVNRVMRDGDSAEAHYLLGASLLGKGDYPKAAAELGQAAAKKPDLPGLESYYGQALLATGDGDGAEAAFRKALKADANDFDANMQLAAILAQRGHPGEALPLVERAAQVRPSSPEAHVALANLLAATGEADAARKERALVAATWPDFSRKQASAAAEARPAAQLQGKQAPGFRLAELGTGRAVELGQFRGVRPVVLVFGSYTCPQLRHAAGRLNGLYAKYGKRAAFLMVYIREAHGAGGGAWQSTENQREGIDLEEAKTAAQREANAKLCARRLHIGYPVLPDEMAGEVEAAYAAWPSRVYVVGKDGVVRYETALDEQSFHDAELEAAIRQALEAKP